MLSAALKVSQPLWKNLQRFSFLFWSYSDLILYFPFLPSFHMQWVFNSFPHLYHFNLGFQFPMQNNAMQFPVFFRQSWAQSPAQKRREGKWRREQSVNSFAIFVGFLFRKMLFTLLCASTNPAPSIILLPHCWPTPCNGIPHYASISTMVNWSMPISHNMVFIVYIKSQMPTASCRKNEIWYYS